MTYTNANNNSKNKRVSFQESVQIYTVPEKDPNRWNILFYSPQEIRKFQDETFEEEAAKLKDAKAKAVRQRRQEKADKKRQRKERLKAKRQARKQQQQQQQQQQQDKDETEKDENAGQKSCCSASVSQQQQQQQLKQPLQLQLQSATYNDNDNDSLLDEDVAEHLYDRDDDHDEDSTTRCLLSNMEHGIINSNSISTRESEKETTKAKEATKNTSANSNSSSAWTGLLLYLYIASVYARQLMNQIITTRTRIAKLLKITNNFACVHKKENIRNETATTTNATTTRLISMAKVLGLSIVALCFWLLWF